MIPARIGIDLDNTLIDYDEAFRSPLLGDTKQAVREALRARGEDGEREWQALQRHVYGPGMAKARLAEGSAAFLRRCRERGVTVFVVSHKTAELRDAARAWMTERGLVGGHGLPPENLHFEATRAEKVERIRALGCEAFIDDLPEVFAEPGFPREVKKILYTKGRGWGAIEAEVFGAGGRNSQVERVERDGVACALKRYRADARDRFGVEKAALQLFERHGLDRVPRWRGEEGGAALLEWIDGSPVARPTAEDVDEACDFIEAVRRLDGPELPPACEACPTAAEILRQIDARIARLEVPPPGRAEAEAHARARLDLHAEAPLRCLVPADLGFHNALRRASDGRLVFLDFEYFGWDDPVKLAADFLLHPGHTLEVTLQARFVRRMAQVFADDPTFTARLDALLPLYALRWELIVGRWRT